MVLTLYKTDSSPPVRAVYMVVEATNIPNVQRVEVDLSQGEHLTEDYLKMNPQHTVPMLKDDDYVVWDSHAIVVYLLSKYTQDTDLYPKDIKKRALIDQRLHFDSGVLFAQLLAAVDPIFFGTENSYRPEVLQKIQKGYDFTDKFLVTPWLAGDKLTLADICCVATISSLNEILPIDTKLYKNLADWFERCKKQEFYKKANEPGLVEFRKLLKYKIAKNS